MSLSDFIVQAWHVLEPATEYVPNWHIDAICDHLEAVSRLEICKLIINVPPGMMKSLLVSVFWPAWEWTQRPHKRIMAASYAQNLATRDSRRMRQLIQSDWYQAHWGHVFQLTHDQNQKLRYDNDRTGFRIALGLDGGATGERADIRIVDDPHKVKDVRSDVKRASQIDTLRTTWANRTNDAATAVEVLIMQRLHEGDATGAYLEDGGYEHLMLPMRYESERKCHTCIGFEDPRTEEGELLFPARFSLETVDATENKLGAYDTAGQHQQKPAPESGGYFSRENFEVVDALPDGGRMARGWDLASVEDGDFTASVKMLRHGNTYYIVDVLCFQGNPADVEKAMKNTASQDGFEVTIDLPQDPGQAGKSQIAYLVSQLSGYRVYSSPETGSKETRAEAVSSQSSVGNIKLLRGEWNKPYLDELVMFPNANFDDQVDATSRAFHRLARPGDTSTESITWR